MLFSTIISTIDSLKSLFGSFDDFTTAKLSGTPLFPDDTLLLPCILRCPILGEFVLSFSPAGEFPEIRRWAGHAVFFALPPPPEFFFSFSPELRTGFVMMGGRSIFETVSPSNFSGGAVAGRETSSGRRESFPEEEEEEVLSRGEFGKSSGVESAGLIVQTDSVDGRKLQVAEEGGSSLGVAVRLLLRWVLLRFLADFLGGSNA